MGDWRTGDCSNLGCFYFDGDARKFQLGFYLCGLTAEAFLGLFLRGDFFVFYSSTSYGAMDSETVSFITTGAYLGGSISGFFWSA